MKVAFILLVGLTVVGFSWELLCRLAPQLAFALPPPSAVLESFATRGDRYWLHTVVTLKEMLAGFALALLVALPIGWGMVMVRGMRVILQPLFVTIQCVPMFVLAPIMVIWFGWSFTAIVIPTALMVFFPLALTIYQGLRSTPPALLDFFRVNGATPWQTLIKLRLPFAVPHLFAGLRIAAAGAGIGAVAGEWAGAQQGLGVLMLESRRATDLATTFGGLICLATVSMGLYLLIMLLEHLALPPRPSLKAFRARWLGLALLPLAFVACGQKEEKSVRLVLDWLPNPNQIPLFVGIEKGFFADENIPLQISKLHDPSDVVPLVMSGRVELGISYMPYTLHSVSQGAPLRVVGVLFKEPLNALIYSEDSAIKSAADLHGKVIGYSLGGFDEAFIAAMNLPHVETRNVNFDLVSSLGTGQVDAVFGACWNIECVHLKHLGVSTGYLPLSTFGIPNYYELIILAQQGSRDWSGVARALQRSIDWCKLHPEEAFEIYVRANPDKSLQTLEWEREAWTVTYPVLASDQHLDVQCFREFNAWLGAQKDMAVDEVDFAALLGEPRNACK